MFRDRIAAGRALAEALAEGAPPAGPGGGPVVMALPRGGVPIAAEVAARLDAPLDLVLVRKVGVPWHPELAAAAVVDGDRPEVVRNEGVIREARINEADLKAGIEAELAEIERRRARWFEGRARPDIEGRPVIVVDDGIATGSTALAALRALRRKRPSELILAVPVAPVDSLRMLAAEADRVICLETPTPFLAVGHHYRDFRQVEDAEVTGWLDRASSPGG